MTQPIARVCLTQIRIPFKETLHNKRGEALIHDAIIVAIESKDGSVGLGECVPRAGGVNSTWERCWNDLTDRIVPELLGGWLGSVEDIQRHAACWVGCSRPAVAAAESACWDLLGRLQHRCLAELLEAPMDRIGVPLEVRHAIEFDLTVVDRLRVIDPLREEGYRHFDLAIRPGEDVEVVRAIRQHFGDDLDLSVHADGTYEQADIPALRALDAFDLVMMTQPLAAEDLTGLAALQAVLETPICLAETVEVYNRAIAALEMDAGRIVKLDLQRLGGFGAALAIHDLCRSRGVGCWVGTSPSLGIGQFQGLHLATLTDCRYPPDLTPSLRCFADDLVFPMLERAEPCHLIVPDRPGLGVRLDPQRVKRYQVRHQEFTDPTFPT